MSNKKDTRRFTTSMEKRLGIVFVSISIFFVILGIRLISWTVFSENKYLAKVLAQQGNQTQTIAYERGKIYDRNGNLLASNEKSYILIFEPMIILEQTRGDEAQKKKSTSKVFVCEDVIIEKLHEYMNLDEDTVRSLIEDHPDSQYYRYKDSAGVAVKFCYDEIKELQEFLDLSNEEIENDMPEEKKNQIKASKCIAGLWLEESYKRCYPYDSLACRVLGFTSGNNGLKGLESYYNDELSGVDGQIYSYFNDRLSRTYEVRDAVNGNSLVTTLDMQIQKIIEDNIKIFDERIGSKETSIIVMDPNNGEVLAMASSNPYNLNAPTEEAPLKNIYSKEEIALLKKNQKKADAEQKKQEDQKTTEASATVASTEQKKEEEDPMATKTMGDALEELWKNPIVTVTHEPGSTYKPFTVVAGLESGTLKGDEGYYCTGSLTVSNRNIGCSHVHDTVNLKQAVAKSCNVAMMNIAFKESKDTFYYYQNLFGFGRKTGIDLADEESASSLVYTAETCTDNGVTLATNAFGQNFNCTMIQLAAGFCSLINGGYYYKPHIVKTIQSDKGDVLKEIDPEVYRNTISSATSATLRSYLKETVVSGTGTKAAIDGYAIGGKTGTAEKLDENGKRNKEDYYVSFVGFTSVDDPELLIYVTIDEPNVDNQASAAMAVLLERECMKDIIAYKGMAPSEKVDEDKKTSEDDYVDEYQEVFNRAFKEKWEKEAKKQK